jgi:formylglycine-generating enzyme required for sulfatase activity
MHTPAALLKFIGRAALNAAGLGLAGEFVADVLPEMARDVWAWWSHASDPAQRCAEVEALVQAPAEEIRRLVTDIVTELAGDRPAPVRETLAAYLNQVPATIRHSLRRPADPSGTTLPPNLVPLKAEDVLPFLPARLPRFKPGDRPLAGVDWELVELLGMGGFGEVWKARNPHLSSVRPAALKFCLDPAAAKVLRNEARLLDRLMLQGRHPGIVPLLQTYLGAEPPCLEYEYVAGGDLAGVIHDWHRRGGGPTAAQAAKVILRLAEIVAYAHRLQPPIVHRDLKPANVLVQKGFAGKLLLRVADFGNGGVAASQALRQSYRGTTESELLVSAVRGACTPLYASPQQLRGSDADPRDDVFSLGVIWYQLLTGNLTAGRPGGTRWPKRLEERGMSTPLIEVLGSCLEDDPDDRPASAAVLAERLAGLLHTGDGAAAGPLLKRLTNAVGLKLTYIPPGSFTMGSPNSEPDRYPDEGPQHLVIITRPFYLGTYPVTQRQYTAVMGENPSYFQEARGGGPDHPVERVSWSDAVEFCRRLSELPEERAAGRVYRLPTEAEWEYACRAGTTTPFHYGEAFSSRLANFNGRYPYGGAIKGPNLEQTSRVGSYQPNGWGLYDLHGNVWEWCQDYYGERYYAKSPREDPQGPTTGVMRVVRGGSCCNIGRFCRSAYRFGVSPGNRDLDVGLRVVMTVAAEGPAVELDPAAPES